MPAGLWHCPLCRAAFDDAQEMREHTADLHGGSTPRRHSARGASPAEPVSQGHQEPATIEHSPSLHPAGAQKRDSGR